MSTSLTTRIKSKARELGFSKVGVAHAERLTEEGKRFHAWLGMNYQAGMHWLEHDVDKRMDPSRVLPQIKSVLCVAMNYFSIAERSGGSEIGKISRYAWGDDYHLVLSDRMEKLFEYVKAEIPGVGGKIYVDTGPVMDKVWAIRAGLGWMGKHTNVIAREYGSWIFLGEILLDRELESDEPMLDYCGSCTACMEACPTQAIVQPYVLDSNKCISYLTIEHRGDLPANLMLKFGNWVYGCDVCQDVCPWNRFQKETEEPAFQPREENVSPALTKLVELTPEEFSRRFHQSPVKRTKHRGLIRNAKALLDSLGLTR
jgi:epoxyqueuosine reductase